MTDGGFLCLDRSYSLCVVYDKWIFYHLMYSSCSYAMRSADWEAFLQNLSVDIKADVPVMTAHNYGNNKLGGVAESHLEEGYFTLPKDEEGTEKVLGYSVIIQ